MLTTKVESKPELVVSLSSDFKTVTITRDGSVTLPATEIRALQELLTRANEAHLKRIPFTTKS